MRRAFSSLFDENDPDRKLNPDVRTVGAVPGPDDTGGGGGAVGQGVSHFGPLLSCLPASVSLCVKRETILSRVLGKLLQKSKSWLRI